MVTKKNNTVADRILAGCLFLMGIEFISSGIDYNQFGYPLLSNAFLLMNPAFYLYIRSLVVRRFKLRWIHLLHLVPYLGFEISVYILQEPLVFNNFLSFDGQLFFRIPFGTASLLSWGVYNLLSLFAVLKHRQKAEMEFSNLSKGRRMGWVLFVLIYYSAVCLTSFILGIVSMVGDEINLFPYYATLVALLSLICFLGFYGLRQDQIYAVIEKDLGIAEKEYKKPQLSSGRKNEIKELIFKAFEDEELYLNADLNMDVLSAHLSLPKHHITEVLNTVIGRNFFQFVNQYRIEAVKKMLEDPNNPYSIEAIGYDCGFSSKSSFFSTFKKLTGITPAQFRAK